MHSLVIMLCLLIHNFTKSNTFLKAWWHWDAFFLSVTTLPEMRYYWRNGKLVSTASSLKDASQCCYDSQNLLFFSADQQHYKTEILLCYMFNMKTFSVHFLFFFLLVTLFFTFLLFNLFFFLLLMHAWMIQEPLFFALIYSARANQERVVLTKTIMMAEKGWENVKKMFRGGG